nr:MAG TPA: Transcriptional regulator [Caudoviricetes sp.]
MNSHKDVQPIINPLQRFAQYDLKMQLSTALTLLYVARFQDEPDGVTTGDLTKWLGMTPAASSRNTYYWGEGTPDMPHSGYRLVDVVVDPIDRRKRLLRLTARGEAFVRQLKETLDG